MEWIEEADGVFRGGGVKGLGLAGALLGFAEHPEKPVKKWVNVAGASAGAIIACYLAVGHDADDIAALMTKTNFGAVPRLPAGRRDPRRRPEFAAQARAGARRCVQATGSAKQLEGKTFARRRPTTGRATA